MQRILSHLNRLPDYLLWVIAQFMLLMVRALYPVLTFAAIILLAWTVIQYPGYRLLLIPRDITFEFWLAFLPLWLIDAWATLRKDSQARK